MKERFNDKYQSLVTIIEQERVARNRRDQWNCHYADDHMLKEAFTISIVNQNCLKSLSNMGREWK